jgi:hypothetical protein
VTQDDKHQKKPKPGKFSKRPKLQEPKPFVTQEDKHQSNPKPGKFSNFGFLYSKPAYVVEQELKSAKEDGIYEIMNSPIPGGKGTLGQIYDVVFLANCQKKSDVKGDMFKDEPGAKRSANGAVKATYGVAVL